MRGNMTPASRTGINRCNVLLARPREHSRKPDVVRQIAVELFGDYPRIELFARHPGPPPDWSAWGNELAGARSARDLRTEAAGSPSDQVDAGGDDDDDDDDGFDLAAKQATKRRRYRPYIPLAPTYEMLESFEPFATQSAQQFVEPDNLEPIVPAVKVNRLDYFFALETASPVHANYAPLTEQAVADNIDYIHNRQRQHADALFKFNYGRR
jgi:hypothetical protein